MSGERWVPTLGFDLAYADSRYLVLKRGGTYVRSYTPDDEVSLRPIAFASDYDEAVRILRALRLSENPTQKAGGDDEAAGQGSPSGAPGTPEPSTGVAASEPPAASEGVGGRVISAPDATPDGGEP